MRVEDATATRTDGRGVGPPNGPWRVAFPTAPRWAGGGVPPAGGPTPRDIAQKVPLLRAFCSAMMQEDCSEKHPSWVVPKCF